KILTGDDGRVRAVATQECEFPADVVVLGIGCLLRKQVDGPFAALTDRVGLRPTLSPALRSGLKGWLARRDHAST
ncbi:hypothetical protein ABTZ58_35900, partial [Streptomyces sp. NPDC094143]|uniref:hypothetical protein n=1 Tax=Streptomyces sp. NPDC094143 TaxID=3155310 RepID=UPI00331A7539